MKLWRAPHLAFSDTHLCVCVCVGVPCYHLPGTQIFLWNLPGVERLLSQSFSRLPLSGPFWGEKAATGLSVYACWSSGVPHFLGPTPGSYKAKRKPGEPAAALCPEP